MGKIQIKLFGRAEQIAQRSKIEVEVQEEISVEDLIKKLANLYGEDFEKAVLRDDISIFLNSNSIKQIDGLKTQVRSGDIVLIFEPVSGGA